MRKALLFVALLAAAVVGAASKPTRLVRLTIVNKSELDVEIRMTGSEDENSYYLRVTKGSRYLPTEKAFTLVPDTYQMQPYYVEIWDPVYGFDCAKPSSRRLELYQNTRVIIGDCNRTLPNAGEPSIVKFGGTNCRIGPRRR